MAALSWTARITNLETDALVATTTELLDPAIGQTIDSAGHVACSFRPGTAFCNAIITAWGGPTYQGPIKAYLLELSQDGSQWDTAMWLESGTVHLGGAQVGVTVDGADIFDGFDRTFIDHATYIGVPIADVFGAAAGQIRVPPNRLMLLGNKLPNWWRGFYGQIPCKKSFAGAYRLGFTAYTDRALATQTVDVDVNSDSIKRATEITLAAGAGTLDPANPGDFGTHQHYSVSVLRRSVYLGYKGTTPILTLTNAKTPTQCNETLEAAIIDSEDGAFIQPNLSAMFAQTQFLAGTSSHNMPDGGRFTAVTVISKPTNGASVSVWDNLPILGISTGKESGGAYYWLRDGALHPMSQQMDVADLVLDGTNHGLYAATTRGIYYRDATRQPYDATPWTRFGTGDPSFYDYGKVWVPAPGIIYAIASGSKNGAGINGVYRCDGAGNAWERVIAAGSIIDASGSDNELYYVDQNDPTTITWTKRNGGNPQAIPMPNKAHVVGMDFNAAGDVVVRTEVGAQGLYRLFGGALSSADPVRSLADGFGPLAVASFVGFLSNAQPKINGQTVNALVATDRGIWWRASSGGQFAPTDGQSGIQSVNAARIDVGAPQTMMGRLFVPLFAVTDRSLFTSYDGGIHWTDELTQPLDAGPAWYAGIKSVYGSYPDNDVGAFGNGAFGGEAVAGAPVLGAVPNPQAQDPTDPEGNGRILLINSGPLTLPNNWIVARRWTANNTLTYRLLDTGSYAPYNALKPAEIIEVQADDSRGVLEASGAVMEAMYRFLAQANRPQLVMNVTTTYSTTTAALRFLNCGDQVLVNQSVSKLGSDGVTTTQLVNMVNTPMYPIKIDGRMDPQTGEWLVDLSLVNSVAFSVLDLQKIVSGLANGQARDRRLARTRIR